MTRGHLPKPVRHGSAYISISLLCASLDAGAAQLPVPCVPGSCGNIQGWVASGQASATSTANTLTVQQTSDRAILNWASFNVSADGKVIFQQPSSTSVALNRIFDKNPSSIFGTVTANGQIYLINTNGFLFGASARVNTSSLIASALNMSDDVFNKGLLSPDIVTQGKPALQSDPVLGPDGKPVDISVTVAAGAQITAASGGRVLLAGPNVTNGGTVQAPDGQVVLAAGQKVYLRGSQDSNVRGLVVEVDSGGKAWNQLSGALSSSRGNVSMVGLAVNQDGRISATTTVTANGSVRLEAGDTTGMAADAHAVANGVIFAQHGGTLELGSQSQIDILPELNDSATAVQAQAQPASQVALLGKQIFMHGGEITAPGGNLTVTARASLDPTQPPASGNPDARIRIDPGTSIDLSGSTAELPMSANIVSAQLRANEFADDPTQRNGVLRGKTVYVDARSLPSPAFANVQGAVDAVPQTIAQRTAKGGTATFLSEGDVVLNPGASINVSGGKTIYDSGWIQTTQVVAANGEAYDISKANPLLTYTGLINPTFTQTFNKWGVQELIPTPGLGHYEAGYVQGAAAGAINFSAPAMVLSGSLAGHAVTGPYQRSTPVPGGTLSIGSPASLDSPLASLRLDFQSPAVEFVRQATPITISDDSALPTPRTLELPTDYLTSGGFTNTTIYSNTSITVPEGVSLSLIPGSQFLLNAPRIDILSDITALGGKLNFQSIATIDSKSLLLPRPGVHVGDGVTLDVRGQWTNDSLALTGPAPSGATLQNGGSISLGLDGSDGNPELVIGDDVSFRASGGAWVQRNGSIVYGTGGNISLRAGSDGRSLNLSPPQLGVALQVGNNLHLDSFGVGTARGGNFTLEAPRLLVSQGTASWTRAQRVDELKSPGDVFEVDAPLFSQYGFSSVNLLASGPSLGQASTPDVLTVAAGTQIVAQQHSLQLLPGYASHGSGGTAQDVTDITFLPDYMRPVTSVTLSAIPSGFDLCGDLNAAFGRLNIERGASIVVDPTASITLSASGNILVNGTLRAPAGQITLKIPTPTDFTQGDSVDPKFLADQRIELGANALLDASGTIQMGAPNQARRLLGTVLAGGQVSLVAERGAVLTQAGSVIDISGTSAPLDVLDPASRSGYTRHTVASAGGSLTIAAPESVSLLGDLRAAAGRGDMLQPQGGALSIEFDRYGGFNPGIFHSAYPSTPRLLQLVADAGAATYGQNGLSLISVNKLLTSGLDSVNLKSDHIDFATSIPLAMGRQISLDAPVLSVASGVRAQVNAPYVSVGNSVVNAPVLTPAPGTGQFEAAGQFIELYGNTALQGVRSASFTSSGDLRLRGVSTNNLLKGSLAIDGDLTLNAARVYPGTNTAFSLTASSVGETIRIGQTSPSPGTPLSAAGAISIQADHIVNAGTLIAPFGTISLQGLTADVSPNSSITLEAGSVTSVSAGNSTIPYGVTQLSGTQWLDYNGNPINAIPARQVTINAPNVSMKPSATVDLRGGGDLYAYEWVPGTGGTADALAPTGTTGSIPGLYAVLPSLRGQYAPYDPQLADSSLAPGASIYLSGVPGLPAGVYPLLPARYALLSGAFLVQAMPTSAAPQGIAPGYSTTLPNGVPVIAGYRTFGNTGLSDPLYSAYAVYPGYDQVQGGYGRQLATYQDTLASTFFANTAQKSGAPRPVLPVDAGHLSLQVAGILDAEGTVLTTAAKGGRGALIDVSAPQIDIVSSLSQQPTPGVVELSASLVQSWAPGSLVIGGRPSQAQDGTTSITVVSDSVTVESGAQLSADQVVLVANNNIDIKSGGTIASSSANSGGAAPVLPSKPAQISLTGNNAAGASFLGVSDLALLDAQRPTGGSSATPGTVQLESGSQLASRGSVTIDSPGVMDLSGTLKVPGASLSLASSSIGFVGTDPGIATDTLLINPSLAGQLLQAGSLQLKSSGAIDLYSSVALGTVPGSSAPALGSLTLAGSSLNNLAGGADSSFAAKTLTLQGFDNSTPAAPPSAGAGTLSLSAGELDIGPGTLSINNFGQVQAAVTGAVIGRGTGTLAVGGDMSIGAAELTAEGESNTKISVPAGTLTLTASSPPAEALPVFLGGSLSLAANVVNDSAKTMVLGGLISIQAAHDITLGSTATLDASGNLISVGTRTVGAAGGAISLKAGGDLNLSAGSRLSVAGVGDSSAGQIALSAAGTATVSSTLDGRTGSSPSGGSFSLDAGQLAGGLGGLEGLLQAGDFNRAQLVRVRNGDLVLDSGSTVSANQIRLTADTGAVRMGGTLTASYAGQRGGIGLFGGQGVFIGSTAALHADTSDVTLPGGNIELGTTTLGSTPGVISIAQGSVFSTSGAPGSGQLLIRAPALVSATPTSNDISVGDFAGDLRGVGQVIIEPVLTNPAGAVGSTLGASDFAAIQASVTNYMANLGNRIQALMPANATNYAIRPGVELDTTGPLTLTGGLDLSQWRFGADPNNQQPIDLTVRSGSGLTLAGNISDGFSVTHPRPTTTSVVLAGCASNSPVGCASSSLRFVAGADLTSADPLAMGATTSANLVLNPNIVVRTGTGEIDLVASGNVTMQGAGTSVYTAGLAGAPTQNTGVGTAARIFNFPTAGGDLFIHAGGDVVGSPVTQSVSDWQIRQGSTGAASLRPAQWGIDFNRFGYNFATLGGGDLHIEAGGAVRDVSAAASDTRIADASAATHFAGGDLSVQTGSDITSGQFYVAQGTGSLRTGGALSSDRSDSQGNLLGTVIALGDAQVSIQARNDVALAAILNPTVLRGAGPNASSAPQFFTYTDDSSVRVQSTSGSITVSGIQPTELIGNVAANSGTYNSALPSSVLLRSLQGDVVQGASAALFPSDNGQLEIFAGRDVLEVGGTGFVLSDEPAALMPTVDNPIFGVPANWTSTGSGISSRHIDDPSPALITAGRDIIGLHVGLPKASRIWAGRDITDLNFVGQNLHSSDVTGISAGRDLTYAFGASTSGQIQLGGPGHLEVLAGRDISLGLSAGISTIGNTLNPTLPTATGADIISIAGLGRPLDYTGFLSDIVSPVKAVALQEAFVTAVEQQKNKQGLSYADALTLFDTLSDAQKREVILPIFFNELLQSGRDHNTKPKTGYERGYAAIDALLPGSRTGTAGPNLFGGDMTLTFSRIYTIAGGSIDLLAPGGLLNVGLAQQPPGLPPRDASQLGIVAQGPGDINIYTKNDVDVNSSRIFTLGGGNILIWSDEGSIDAGRGAKTSLSVPPPQILIDPSTGNVTFSIAGLAQGSGIRTIQALPGVPPGNVDLDAPVGTVNAGDAGIGAAGNLNVAAAQVVGVDNIQVGGTSTGVPPSVGNLGAALSGASSTASSASNTSNKSVAESAGSKEAAAPLASSALSWLDVFVEGFGSEVCKADDAACMKRNQATP